MHIVCLNEKMHKSDEDYMRECGYAEIIYHYTNEYYDGYGKLIALRFEDDEPVFDLFDLSHCSCFGPVDYSPIATYTVHELNEILFGPNVLDTNDLGNKLTDFLRHSVKASEARILGN